MLIHPLARSSDIDKIAQFFRFSGAAPCGVDFFLLRRRLLKNRVPMIGTGHSVKKLMKRLRITAICRDDHFFNLMITRDHGGIVP